MTYQCFNREAFEPSMTVQDGWENSWARRIVDIEFRGTEGCVYSTSDLGMKDKGCTGCTWRANGQADTGTDSPEEPVQVGDSVATVRPGESGLAGIAGPADVGGSSDAAEHGGSEEQARAAEKLEAIHPSAKIYRRAE